MLKLALRQALGLIVQAFAAVQEHAAEARAKNPR